ncbi:unnamed protein product [Cuscuta campestris]|uniref:Uncharacterized protein n=1 Tax=Cuscuta campestris TaxID=132261 RepID=A0A484LZT6_9ASTE|nr:unnamed protein product [Cuscuta campestris]
MKPIPNGLPYLLCFVAGSLPLNVNYVVNENRGRMYSCQINFIQSLLFDLAHITDPFNPQGIDESNPTTWTGLNSVSSSIAARIDTSEQSRTATRGESTLAMKSE